MSHFHDAAFCGDLAEVQQCLAEGHNVDERGQDDVTPLYCAAMEGHLEVMRELIAHGADVNAQAVSTYTPLIAATDSGESAAMRVLLDAGANANQQSKDAAVQADGYAALHCAASKGAAECVRVLIAAGADVNARWTAPSGNGADAHVFSVTALHDAAAAGFTECVRLLAAAGADVNCPTEPVAGASPVPVSASASGAASEGWRPLHYAAQNGKVETCEALISLGATVDVRTDRGMTPLRLAIRANQLETVRLLLESGADPLVSHIDPGADVLSPVDMMVPLADALSKPDILSEIRTRRAAWLGRSGSAFERLAWPIAAEDHAGLAALLTAGVDPNASNAADVSILEYAAHYPNPDAVKLLIRWGANVNARDKAGRTALSAAQLAGDSARAKPETIQLLQRSGGIV